MPVLDDLEEVAPLLVLQRREAPVSSVIALLDGAPALDGQTIDLLWSGLGTHTLSVTASDAAGWTTQKSVSFQLAVTMDSLRAEILALRARGEIDSNGIVQSLLAKLGRSWWLEGARSKANRLGALEAEVRAQRGKHVTERAADLLLADVRALSQSLN